MTTPWAFVPSSFFSTRGVYLLYNTKLYSYYHFVTRYRKLTSSHLLEYTRLCMSVSILPLSTIGYLPFCISSVCLHVFCGWSTYMRPYEEVRTRPGRQVPHFCRYASKYPWLCSMRDYFHYYTPGWVRCSLTASAALAFAIAIITCTTCKACKLKVAFTTR